MRQRMERLVILPFSAGCISEASVAVGLPHPRRSKPDTNSPPTAISLSLSQYDINNDICLQTILVTSFFALFYFPWHLTSFSF